MRHNEGIVIPFFVLLIPLLIGLAGFVIDVGQQYSIKTRIQSAIDLATLAGASQISTSSSVSNIKNTALNYLNNNLTMTLPSFQALTLDSDGLLIQVSVYDSTVKTFTENESLSNANSLRISYDYNYMTLFTPIFMIDSLQISDHAISARQAAGYMPPGTGFPLVLDSSTLSIARSNNNMLDLFQSGTGENSYWTTFTNNTPTINDVRDIIDYFQYGTGIKPPGLTVNDTFVINNGSKAGLYMDMEPSVLIGMTYVFPIVTTDMTSTVKASGFVGATVNDIYDNMGDQHVSITIDPKYVDNSFSGLGIGPGPANINPDDQGLLANAFGLIE